MPSHSIRFPGNQTSPSWINKSKEETVKNLFSYLASEYLLLPTYLHRRLQVSRLLKNTADFDIRDRKAFVTLSSDTEYDPPSRGGTWKKRSTRALLDGLPRFLEICDLHAAPATFFCEGKLVQDMPDLFRDLSAKHEIGCHSFAHEWLGTGPPPRLIPRREDLAFLSVDQKNRVLRRAMQSIQEVIGKRPKSFKAPFDSIDHPSTLALLEEAGFESDSSLPSYNSDTYNKSFLPTRPRHASKRDLWREGRMHIVEVPYMAIPPTLFPKPFQEQVLLDIASRSPRIALKIVDIQCRFDHSLGLASSVVHITTHPWQFSNTRPWGRGWLRNLHGLAGFLRELSGLCNVEFLTISDLVRKWENEDCGPHSGERENHFA
jgi:peptidoglycan/xylan/chitin deacetylase (PgdA/CDA1 family)